MAERYGPREAFSWLYRGLEDGNTYVWLRDPQGAPERPARTLPCKARDLARLDEDDLRLLVHGRSGQERWQVYFGLGLHRDGLVLGDHDRVHAADIVRMPAFLIDADVKPGAFGSQDEVADAVAFLRALGVGAAGMVVWTGSGGAHGYSRAEGGMEPARAQQAGFRTRALLEAEFRVRVDSTFDPSRVARVPGTIRWPKHAEAEAGVEPAPVVLREEPLGALDLSGLWAATESAWSDHLARVRAHRQRVLDGEGAASGSGDPAAAAEVAALRAAGLEVPYSLLFRAFSSELRDAFGARVTWAGILEPAGWENTSRNGKPDRDGRTQWMRPSAGGRDRPNPRSATTGFDGKDGAPMSLLSASAATGLSVLAETGLPLTRLRVAAALYADGDVYGLLGAWDEAGRPARLDGVRVEGKDAS